MQSGQDDAVDWSPITEQRSEGRSLTPPRKRVARAMTAPGSVRGGVVKRKLAISRRQGSSSRFRGVTHHCRTGRWEAHIWEDGKQVYLGGFDNEEQAALAYDIAAIKFRAHDANTNYNISNYEQELLHFDEVSKEEVVQSLRKQSRGAQKTSSQYRGVTKHQKGKWEARIGQMVGRKYKYLGLYKEEIDAATAYDREAVRRRGIHAVTNFDLSEYIDLLDEASIAEAEARHLFKPKPLADAVTTETTQGLYYTQVAQPMQKEGHEGFSDVQLVQTDLHHTSEDSAVNNLQQYGSYMVVGQPNSSADTSAMHSSYADAEGVQSAYDNSHNDSNNNGGAAVTWYGNLEGHAAINAANADQMQNAAWDGQQAVHYTAVAKKGAPGDVSRHDTPTSVFDIFNALSIVPGSPRMGQMGYQPADHHEPAFGQEPAFTDIPHLNSANTPSYQAMIVEDNDDWLHDFALSQLQVNSPAAVPAIGASGGEQLTMASATESHDRSSTVHTGRADEEKGISPLVSPQSQGGDKDSAVGTIGSCQTLQEDTMSI